MNDIGRLAHVEQAVSPLHVRAYFDQALYAREQERIFKQCATYMGHEKGVPEPGDWRRLPHEEGGRVLVRNARGVELVSNVCRHRQALILGGETGAVTGPGNPAATCRPPAATSSARCTAGPTTTRAICSARRSSPAPRA